MTEREQRLEALALVSRKAVNAKAWALDQFPDDPGISCAGCGKRMPINVLTSILGTHLDCRSLTEGAASEGAASEGQSFPFLKRRGLLQGYLDSYSIVSLTLRQQFANNYWPTHRLKQAARLGDGAVSFQIKG